jgi:phosphate transport system protein
MTLRPHTSNDYEAELVSVRDKVLEMGRQVDELMDSSERALVHRDIGLAQQIILSDQETDSLELEIDHLCLEILARRQPVAGDLRLLTSALKVVIDLERIGDLAVSIAQRVAELGREPPLGPYDNLVSMMTVSREILTESLAALVAGDVARASQAIDKDEVVDAYYVQIFNDVLGRMRDDPDSIFRATRIQAISKYIERIGDHATNVAERVIFVLTGEDLRRVTRPRHHDLS